MTHRQELAIAAILASRSLEEARRKVRAAKGTFYGWMKDSAFQTELKRQRQMVIDEALEQLKAGLMQAVDKVLELLMTGQQPGLQLKAAQLILDYGLKTLEREELENRILQLEELVFSKGNKWQITT